MYYKCIYYMCNALNTTHILNMYQICNTHVAQFWVFVFAAGGLSNYWCLCWLQITVIRLDLLGHYEIMWFDGDSINFEINRLPYDLFPNQSVLTSCDFLNPVWTMVVKMTFITDSFRRISSGVLLQHHTR